jgi:hypothetical protein
MLTTVLKLGPEMTGIVEEIQRILAGIQYHYVSFDVLTGISCIVPIVLCCESRPPTDAEKQTMLNAMARNVTPLTELAIYGKVCQVKNISVMVFEKTAWDTIKTSWDIDDGAVMAKTVSRGMRLYAKMPGFNAVPYTYASKYKMDMVITTPT